MIWYHNSVINTFRQLDTLQTVNFHLIFLDFLLLLRHGHVFVQILINFPASTKVKVIVYSSNTGKYIYIILSPASIQVQTE